MGEGLIVLYCTNWSSYDHKAYLPAFSELSFAIFDLNFCVELSQSKTKPGVPFCFLGGRKFISVSRKTRSTFWQKTTAKKGIKDPQVTCKRERCESHANIRKKRQIELGNQDFSLSS